jgi:hypothetical protein
MKFILKDLDNNMLKKKNIFFFKKLNIIDSIRLRHKILITDKKSYELRNSIYMFERMTGFVTQISKFYYHNQFLKHRKLSLIIFLEILINSKYLYIYLNYLFYYMYNFNFLINKFNICRRFILFQKITFSKKIFFMKIFDSYRFINFFNIYNAFLITYLKFERFICYIYIYNNLLNMGLAWLKLIKKLKKLIYIDEEA